MSTVTISDYRCTEKKREIGIMKLCRIATQNNGLGRLLVAMETLTLNQLKTVAKTIKDEENLFRSSVLLKIKEIEEKRDMQKFLQLPKEDRAVFGGVYKGKGFSIKFLPTIEVQR